MIFVTESSKSKKYFNPMKNLLIITNFWSKNLNFLEKKLKYL